MLKTDLWHCWPAQNTLPAAWRTFRDPDFIYFSEIYTNNLLTSSSYPASSLPGWLTLHILHLLLPHANYLIYISKQIQGEIWHINIPCFSHVLCIACYFFCILPTSTSPAQCVRLKPQRLTQRSEWAMSMSYHHESLSKRCDRKIFCFYDTLVPKEPSGSAARNDFLHI